MNEKPVSPSDRPGPRTVLFVWAVLLFVAFDLLTSPLHAHDHAFSGDWPKMHVADPGPSTIDRGWNSLLSFDHSLAVLRADSPRLIKSGIVFLACLAVLIAAIAVGLVRVERWWIRSAPWLGTADHWRPPGRAPPPTPS